MTAPASFFITSTGTDGGKTFVGELLGEAAASKGRQISFTKPVMSGFPPEEQRDSDICRLLRSAGLSTTRKSIDEACPWRYAAPLAPPHAARRAGESLDYAEILEYCRNRMRISSRYHFFEGAGGVMSPLTDDRLNIDMITDMCIPAIVVVPAYLGAVSHALCALEVMQGRGVKIAAIVLNDRWNQPYMLELVAEDLERHGNCRNIHRIVHDSHPEKLARLSRKLLNGLV